MKNDCKYSEEGVSLSSGRFGKALKMRVASEGFLRILVVSESVEMGERGICVCPEGEGRERGEERSVRRHVGK